MRILGVSESRHPVNSLFDGFGTTLTARVCWSRGELGVPLGVVNGRLRFCGEVILKEAGF